MKRKQARLNAERVFDQQMEELIDYQRELLARDLEFFKAFSRALQADNTMAAAYPPEDLQMVLEMMIPFARLGWQAVMFKMEDKYTRPA